MWQEKKHKEQKQENQSNVTMTNTTRTQGRTLFGSLTPYRESRLFLLRRSRWCYFERCVCIIGSFDLSSLEEAKTIVTYLVIANLITNQRMLIVSFIKHYIRQIIPPTNSGDFFVLGIECTQLRYCSQNFVVHDFQWDLSSNKIFTWRKVFFSSTQCVMQTWEKIT